MSDTSARDIFEAALELPPDQRPAFLTRACRRNGAMRARVERLLRAHEAAGDFLAIPALCPDDDTQSVRFDGPYTLLGRLGEGGFGTVYLARQERPIRREVAIKIIRRGMDTKEVIARFEAERQVLALMDHPGIARVFDAGTTADGLPYFVMELVRGEAITTHCDERMVSIEGRLQLFQRVCEAVQHAHTKGIIHRDLKASNVLITVQNGEAVPKIIDFGIAKAVAAFGAGGADRTRLTEQHQLVGTPQSMSPEQAEGSPDIDTRTDIYSLGVLLYELLCSAPPFGAERLRAAPLAEVQRIIREEDPPLPSRRIADAPASDSVAHRGTDPQRLASVLRSDLDWITMKCLEKDRGRRYETASGLAADVGRYLSGRPVVAAPPSRVYRARKFLRRHRPQALAATVIALSLVAAMVGTTTFALREARQRAQAERYATDLDRVAAFQASLLANVNAQTMGRRLRDDQRSRVIAEWQRRGLDEDEIAARTDRLDADLGAMEWTTLASQMLSENILLPALASIESEFAGQPRIRARLLQDVGVSLRRLGLFDAAAPPLREALAIWIDLLGPEAPEVLAGHHELAGLLVLSFKEGEAEPHARAAHEGRRRLLGADHRETLASQYQLGQVLQRQFRLAEAEELQRACLERRRATLPEDSTDTLYSIWRLGQVLTFQARYAEAEPLAREAAERTARVLGEDHHLTIAAMGTLAHVLQRQGYFEEAHRLWKASWAGHRRVLGDDHRDTLFQQCKLCNMLIIRGMPEDLAEAERLGQEVADRRARLLGPDHPDTLESRRMLAMIDDRQGAPEAAAELLHEVLERLRATRGAAHPETLACARQAVDLLDRLGRTDAAKELRTRTVRDTLKALRGWSADAEFPGLTVDFFRLLRAMNAREEQGEFLTLIYERMGRGSSAAWSHQVTLARHLAEAGGVDRLAAAEAMAREAAEWFRINSEEKQGRLRALDTHGLALLRKGRALEALAMFNEARPLVEARGPAMLGPDGAAAWVRRAECLTFLGRFEEAERELTADHDRLARAGLSPAAARPVHLALVNLYETWYEAEQRRDLAAMAARWRQELDATPLIPASADPVAEVARP